MNRSNSLRSRRSASKAGLTGALLAPAAAHAQQTFNWKMTSAYVKGSPFYRDGPGSATDLARRTREMSNGQLNIQVFGAGVLLPIDCALVAEGDRLVKLIGHRV